MKTYKSFITEKKGDTVVFTFGRFNPPTVGHEKLIMAVQSVARSKGADFFVYPSHSQDPKKNPLNQTTKIKYMKKRINESLKCKNAHKAYIKLGFAGLRDIEFIIESYQYFTSIRN